MDEERGAVELRRMLRRVLRAWTRHYVDWVNERHEEMKARRRAEIQARSGRRGRRG